LRLFILCAAVIVATAMCAFADPATPIPATSLTPATTESPTAAPLPILPVTPSRDFGSPPPGDVPILFNHHHVYARPDMLRRGRLLGALVKDGAILVPLRSMFEQMGATVSYDAATKSVKATKTGSEIQVTAGKNKVLINGESRPLDVAPIMQQGVLLVPVRVISEVLGAFVRWVPKKHLTVVRYRVATPLPMSPSPLSPTPVPSPT
jgi:hypothetical protein